MWESRGFSGVGAEDSRPRAALKAYRREGGEPEGLKASGVGAEEGEEVGRGQVEEGT